MPAFSTMELTLAALTVEAALGYPDFVYRAVGHPVTWMGACLAALETRFNRDAESAKRRRLLGAVCLGALLGASAIAGLAVSWLGTFGIFGEVLQVALASSLLAQRSLNDHVEAVADALENQGLEAGRAAVAKIVGRNANCLDAAGVARAAIESLAENFSDGVVAPAFWMALCGISGALLYKATNTADSMIGHKTPRLRAFGWAAARLDDVVNIPAARLSALLLAAAAGLGGGSPAAACRAVWRDARKHRSPNAGWPEAAMAGALGLRLAGPRVYGDELVEDAFMGAGRREAKPADIRRALRLFRGACAIQWSLALVLCFIWRW
jgi:adenosylcobinamide-phosphate synthase